MSSRGKKNRIRNEAELHENSLLLAAKRKYEEELSALREGECSVDDLLRQREQQLESVLREELDASLPPHAQPAVAP